MITQSWLPCRKPVMYHFRSGTEWGRGFSGLNIKAPESTPDCVGCSGSGKIPVINSRFEIARKERCPVCYGTGLAEE